MPTPLPPKLRTALFSRKLATIYGIVVVNIGALLLYDRISQGGVVFDSGFKAGAVCVLVGLLTLYFARKSNHRP